jgi:hypothetical protein
MQEDKVRRGTPIRYMAVESCDKVRRNVFCRNYGECLDHTIQKKWPGFSCERCSSYEQERFEGDQLGDDYARCVALAFFSGAVEFSPKNQIVT